MKNNDTSILVEQYKKNYLKLKVNLDEKFEDLKKIIENNLKKSVEVSSSINRIVIILNQALEGLNFVDIENESYQEKTIQKKIHDLVVLERKKNNFLTLFHNKKEVIPKEKIKKFLAIKNTNMQKKIDMLIKQYLNAQADLLANYIAYHHVLRHSESVREICSYYPDATFEILVLKRHEVCTYNNKGFGLKLDAGLNVFDSGDSKAQTYFELTLAQKIQSKQIHFLKKINLINHVHAIVSPVTRAFQTALYATFTNNIVDKVTIDNHFSEKQSNFRIFASGRASNDFSFVASLFTEAGYQNVNVMQALKINGESEREFKNRVQQAYNSIVTSILDNKQGMTMTFVVGHGNINRAFIAKLNSEHKINGLEMDSYLEFAFGDQYQFMIVRDNLNKIVTVEFIGKYDHYGDKIVQNENSLSATLKK